MNEPPRYLGLSGLAKRAGITTGTARRYSTEDRLPTPDVIIGNGPRAVRGWSRRTVDAGSPVVPDEAPVPTGAPEPPAPATTNIHRMPAM